MGIDIAYMQKEYINKLSKEEKEKLIDESPRNILTKLIEIHGKVNSLIDFINIISQLQVKDFNVHYTRELKEQGLDPGIFLNEYVILEISNFYTLTHLEKEIKFPEPPQYWEKLKIFRNAVPGHADKDKAFKTNKELRELHESMDKIGLDIILKDFNDYFEKCMDFLTKIKVQDE